LKDGVGTYDAAATSAIPEDGFDEDTELPGTDDDDDTSPT
jgi:hypothetical protein